MWSCFLAESHTQNKMKQKTLTQMKARINYRDSAGFPKDISIKQGCEKQQMLTQGQIIKTLGLAMSALLSPLSSKQYMV